jgi:hypothetical protein
MAATGVSGYRLASMLDPAPGGLVLVAWAAALSVLRIALAVRRDVD